MKTTSKYIAMTALALCAVACSQNEEIALTFQNDPNAVRITAQVGSGYVSGGFTRSNPIGTAEEQTQFNAGDKIGVMADNQTAVIYTYNGSTWEPEGDKYLTWQAEEMTFYAWYPVADGTNHDYFYPTYSSNPTLADLQANDYMNFSGSVTKDETASVSLAMNRQMTRIVIDEIIYSGHYNAIDNEVTAITARTNGSQFYEGHWSYSVTKPAPMYKHTDGKWYVVIAPCAGGSEETFLEITLNGVDEPLIVKGLPFTMYNIGCSFSYTLTIVGKEEVGIGIVDISTWKSGIIGDEAEEAGKIAVIDATAMSADELKSCMDAELDNNVLTFEVELNANDGESDEKFIAMKDAFYRDVPPGSIDLTVSGVTSVPLQALDVIDALKTITLPDAVEAGRNAFRYNRYITSINAPKLEVINARAFENCPTLRKITLGATSVAEDDWDGDDSRLFGGTTSTESIDLILSPAQKVMTQQTTDEGINIWTAADSEEYYKDSEEFANKSFLGCTFKSISFAE